MHPLDLDSIPSGQETVSGFPRPSIAQPIHNYLRAVLVEQTIAQTRRGARTIATSHPPTYYFPFQDIALDARRPATGFTFCAWKGSAICYDAISEDLCRTREAWSCPTLPFEIIRDHIAFYTAAPNACLVDDEAVVPRPGGLYGGWITVAVSGPFKGDLGSRFR